MTTILIVGLVMTLYTMIGVVITRKKYTNWYRLTQQFTKPTQVERASHSPSCYLRFPILDDYGCSCRLENAWKSANTELIAYRKSVGPEPTLGYVVIWPFLVATDIIKGGAAKVPNYNAIMQLESKYIKEL